VHFGKEADLSTGAEKVLRRQLARFFALASFALALASCQMFTPPDVQESGFQPSDKPITVDNVVANAKLAEMAKAQHPRILATYGGEYADPKLERMVAKVVGNLTLVSSNPAQTYRITILNSPNVNAFALPGGFMYVNTGLLLATQNEAELAGVMAHEIAHVAARHATRQMTRQKMVDFASLPLIFVGGGVGMILQTAVGAAKPLGFNKFSRSFESEADYLGAQYLYKAGYDPAALISFFERINTMQRRKSGVVAKAFSTHPETRDRINKLQRELGQILPTREIYEVSTSDFDEVITRLVAIEGSSHASAGSPKPTLRRHISIQAPPTTPEPPDR